MAHKRKPKPQELPGARLRNVGYPQRGRGSLRFRQDIPVEVFIPEDQYIDYADAFVINHTEEEFILSFLQLQFPIAISQEQLDKIKSAETVCIARIALTPKRLRILIQALQDNLRSYEEGRSSNQEEGKPQETAEEKSE
ncbi:MAG: DUF3467 domain-containing protein [Acidobacteriota bacterium]|nr:DUF3467 domain-containing protein [Acidobacteriota bacterium]